MKAPAAALQDDKAIRAAIDLYARVLADLEGLAQRSEIASPAYDTIKEFYSGRLTAQQVQEAARQRALTIDTCIWAARSLAHTTTRNRLSEALATLDDVLRRIPDEPVLQEMAREVRAQIEKRDQARRAAQAARELLVAARAAMVAGRLEEAEAKLVEAQGLDSANLTVADALKEVRHRLAERRGQAKAAPAAAAARKITPSIALTIAPEITARPIAAPAGGHDPPVQRIPEAVAARAEPVPFAAPVEAAALPSFADEEEAPGPVHRFVEAASAWSQVLKPFLLDNVGWFIGAFLIVAGFVVLIVTFWQNIESNRILLHSMVYLSLVSTTALFFALAYFVRLKHPELETTSNVLLIIVSLLIPLIFAAAALTTLVPA